MQSSLTKQIPNIITIFSLISGCISISMAIQGNYEVASYLIFLSAVLDFFDGLLARWLNAVSGFGKVLDSLSDIVSFGVAPAVLMYQIIVMSLTYNDSTFNLESADFVETLILLSSFLITVFSAIRLARFTIAENNKEFFQGLPTPAVAILVASISLILFTTETIHMQEFILNNLRLIVVVLVLSFLMVINIPMLKLSLDKENLKLNAFKYIFIICAGILLIIFKLYAIPLIIVLYIIISIISTLFNKA